MQPRLILGNRGSGKTTELIKLANELSDLGQHVIILVSRKGDAETLYRDKLRSKVEILNFYEYQREARAFTLLDNVVVLIDEVEHFLQNLLGGTLGYMVLNKENFKNVVNVHRELRERYSNSVEELREVPDEVLPF